MLLTAVLILSMLTACSSPQNNSAQDTTKSSQSTKETPAQNDGNGESTVPEPEPQGDEPASVSNITSVENVPFAQRLETRKLAEQYDIQIECCYPLGHADDRLLNDDVLSQIAADHNKSVVQIILRWHIQEGFSAIPGSTNPDHIQENIEIFDFELSDEEMEQIRVMDQGEDSRYFNLNYEQMGGFFTKPLN